MLIDSARRAEAAAKEMLGYVNDGSVSCAELREALAVCKAFMAAGSAFQAGAARIIAQAERHGDGGAQVLADAAGLSRRDAHSQVKTARVIETSPTVRDAVESGRVSPANAKRLADALEKTSAADVEADRELLAKAESMRPEQFAREARRWTADHQADGGESDYRRLRARRCVRMWDGDDGMVHLRGEFDPITGKRIANRLREAASRLHDADKQQAADSNGRKRHSFDQCMADALDQPHQLRLHERRATAAAGPSRTSVWSRTSTTPPASSSPNSPTGSGYPRPLCSNNSPAMPSSPASSMTVAGKPIWRTQSRRTVTEAQWQLLIAKWGGCFHCGANPGICQGHHIELASQGGPTKLDNLVPACWSCHHRIHHDNWRIHKHPDGWHTLHPPDRTHHGPAQAPDYPPLGSGPGTNKRSRAGPAPPRRADTAAPASTQPPAPGTAPPRWVPNRPRNPQHEPLFTLS